MSYDTRHDPSHDGMRYISIANERGQCRSALAEQGDSYICHARRAGQPEVASGIRRAAAAAS